MIAMNVRESGTASKTAWLLVAVLCFAKSAYCGPLLEPGDMILRHDLQVLSDNKVLSGPTSTWPIAWGAISVQLDEFEDVGRLSDQARFSLFRMRARTLREIQTDQLSYSAYLAGADSPARWRSFRQTPRDSFEVEGGLSWTGRVLSVTLKGQLVDQAQGETEARADGSMIGVAIGNFSVAVSSLERWWGPGWDGSLILSNNARPFPAVTIDRNLTDEFQSKWLRWIGPWDVSAIMGKLESDRYVPGALFFGLRLNARPLPWLEIGVSRTAQWCGDDRPCDWRTFGNLLLGRDNRGDEGIEVDNEPGNQLAGLDFRWSFSTFGLPSAVYAQFIGEDEAGGFPSRFLGQFGFEASGMWGDNWSWQWFAELARTDCEFFRSDEGFNCAYNHSIYQTGYRYEGRSIGHGTDNDAQIFSTGLTLGSLDETQWGLLVRVGELNRGGALDFHNTVSAVPQDLFSLDLTWDWRGKRGTLGIGIGVEQTQSMNAETQRDGRIFLQWRSTY